MSRTLTNITLGLLTIPVIMLQGGTTVAQQAQMPGSASHEHLVATCAEVPPGQKRPEFGCFIIATKKGLHFTQPTVYWHLRVFPSRVEAQAVKSPTGIVVEEDGRVWLSEFGAQDSAPRGGEGIAVIGPLELTGDAALAFDPLSGQGVLKSIETGTRCAAAIAGYFAGDPNALKAYDTWVQETYHAYLSERRKFYGGVLRWPGSQFWKRRQLSEERRIPGTRRPA